MPKAFKYVTLPLIFILIAIAIYSLYSSFRWTTLLILTPLDLIPLAILASIYFAVKKDFHITPAEDLSGLKSTGKKVMTTFKAMDRMWNIAVNGQSPVIVYTQDDSGRAYESDQLWFSGSDSELYDDPTFQAWQQLQRLSASAQVHIPVYVDQKNPDKYFMDLAALEIKS